MIEELIVLGISGNIGEQTLDVIKNDKNFLLTGFSLGNKIDVIPSILKEHKEVKAICVKNKKDYLLLKDKYKKIKFYYGDKGLVDLIKYTHSTLILNSLVGFVGLLPTLTALDLNIDIALANKESLVCGGEIIKQKLLKSKSNIYPVDSEHAAIYKCLQKINDDNNVKQIYITASGGAFRNLKRSELNNVTKEDALHHPTWKMGPKVTIDSASMLNKGFELIEAYYLFNFPFNKYKVILHDESRVHSFIVTKDNKIYADVSDPDMRNPIKEALYRFKGRNNIKVYKSLDEIKNTHFHAFNPKRYPMVGYAKKALRQNKGIILNSIDEIMIDAFLSDKCSFLDIEYAIKEGVTLFNDIKIKSYSDLVKLDKQVKKYFATKIGKISK